MGAGVAILVIGIFIPLFLAGMAGVENWLRRQGRATSKPGFPVKRIKSTNRQGEEESN